VTGASANLSLTLPAGHYVLLCNLPGHYAGGMSTHFTVGQAPPRRRPGAMPGFLRARRRVA